MSHSYSSYRAARGTHARKSLRSAPFRSSQLRSSQLRSLQRSPLPRRGQTPRENPLRALASAGVVIGMGIVGLGLAMLEGLWSETSPVGTNVRRRRIAAFSMALSLLAFAVVGRLYMLQGAQYEAWARKADRQHVAKVEVQGARGDVLDSAGRTLAVSVQAVSLGVHPHQVTDKARAAQVLSKITGTSEKELGKVLRSKKPFVWIGRGLPFESDARLRDESIPGLVSVKEFRRHYPQGALASTVLGRVGTDGKGLSGIELQYDNRLSAPTVQLPMRRDAKGRLALVQTLPEQSLSDLWAQGDDSLSPVGDGMIQNVKADMGKSMPDYSSRQQGEPVRLTIDSMIQNTLEEEFAQGVIDSKAKRVFGLLMDAENGEIIGMAQALSNQAEGKNKEAEANKDLVSPAMLRNIVIQDNFEPGSTMKPLVAALALSHRVAKPLEEMFCENGRYPVSTHVIRDVHPVGNANLRDVLVRSSNICMVKLGQRLGAERLFKGLQSYGFGTAGGVEVPGEAKGILRNVNAWREIDVATHSFGQGVAVTAVQLVRAYAALANGGYLVQPTLLRHDGRAVERKRILPEKVANEISEYLVGVTEDDHGTGQKASIPGVRVMGKTGTAQKARKSGRGYDPDRVSASFVGYVDAREIGIDRRLVMLVLVDEPGVMPRWGGSTAGPVFKRAMGRVLSYLLTQDPRSVRTAKASTSHRATSNV